jgi:hypothetical protein
MAKCFCGCGKTVKGLGPRGGNKMGQKSVEVTQRLRYAMTLVADLEARQVHVGDTAPMREHVDSQLQTETALGYEQSWAFFAHGNQMDTNAEFLAFRRDWYEWTKKIDALTTALELSPEDLRRL